MSPVQTRKYNTTHLRLRKQYPKVITRSLADDDSDSRSSIDEEVSDARYFKVYSAAVDPNSVGMKAYADLVPLERELAAFLKAQGKKIDTEKKECDQAKTDGHCVAGRRMYRKLLRC